MRFNSFVIACVTFLFFHEANWFVLKKCALLRKLRSLECISFSWTFKKALIMQMRPMLQVCQTRNWLRRNEGSEKLGDGVRKEVSYREWRFNLFRFWKLLTSRRSFHLCLSTRLWRQSHFHPPPMLEVTYVTRPLRHSPFHPPSMLEVTYITSPWRQSGFHAPSW